ncbi:MAG: hypothetical protein QM775_19780 [Pirellulales bacterium]
MTLDNRSFIGFVSGMLFAAASALHSEQPAHADEPAAASAKTAPLDGRDGRDLALENFRPQSMLHVPVHHLPRAKFPVVDVHVHPKIRLHHSPEARRLREDDGRTEHRPVRQPRRRTRRRPRRTHRLFMAEVP